MKRLMMAQYFFHLYARSRYGSSVSIDQSLELGAEPLADQELAKAEPLINQCLAAHPLADGSVAVKLPQDPVERFAACFAAHATIPSMMEMWARETTPSDRREAARDLGARAIRLESLMLNHQPDLTRTYGLDWPKLSRKTDEMRAKLPDIGRQDYVTDACTEAYKAPPGAGGSGK